ncbi:PAS domain S-box protein [Rhodoplanes sp. TEM]|uniref:Blue-light-activated histidine kinase n=1 Tax=Rhodoplanes tepidamans TaxID=200616 RepID=A0ABT5J6P1_RHOTP|nr:MULTISPECIES: PAS domain S-box protein [Rhodoplanes]MDC7785290.1 PAS domain S-box protein [Rhodoplanes tepidamans]MDC7984643.1 PAS domain S-box protein [Rhodoplanes sp. TEM]MDQ0353548.1 PAS domain S-box-containing protein [Rhodoplanes tepidamans]
MSDVTAEIRLLVVDDDEHSRYAKARALRAAGWTVSEGASVSDAIAQGASGGFDLVVLDVRLPDGSGTEACERIKAQCPDTLVLLTSAFFTDAAGRVRGLDSGADGYLVEPADPRVLVATVRSLLRIRDAEGRSREADARLAAIVGSSHDPIVSKDLDGVIRTWNAAAERVFGYEAAEIVGRPVSVLIPPDRRSEAAWIMERIAAGERIDQHETVRLKKSGEPVHVALSISPIRDASGTIVGAAKTVRDITERRQAQDRQHILNRELSHRIKNLLATVQAIAHQTFRDGQLSAEAIRTFNARLAALSSANDILTGENWGGADLQDIVSGIVALHVGAEPERFRLDGPGVRLPPDASVLVSMGLHELCTNALKYGALSATAGRVRIGWTVRQADGQGTPRLWLRWEEEGGPPVERPARRGFGTRLVTQVLAEGLNAAVDLDYAPRGVVCTIDAPLPAGVASHAIAPAVDDDTSGRSHASVGGGHA